MQGNTLINMMLWQSSSIFMGVLSQEVAVNILSQILIYIFSLLMQVAKVFFLQEM